MIWTCPQCGKLVKASNAKVAERRHSYVHCSKIRVRPQKNYAYAKKTLKTSYSDCIKMDIERTLHE